MLYRFKNIIGEEETMKLANDLNQLNYNYNMSTSMGRIIIRTMEKQKLSEKKFSVLLEMLHLQCIEFIIILNIIN